MYSLTVTTTTIHFLHSSTYGGCNDSCDDITFIDERASRSLNFLHLLTYYDYDNSCDATFIDDRTSRSSLVKAAIKGLYSLTYGDGDICASKSLIPLVEESCGKRFGMQYRRACEMMQLSLMTVPNLFYLHLWR